MVLIFTTISILMEFGLTIAFTATYGFPTMSPTDGALIPMGTGSGQTMAGHGALSLHGAGLLFIMGAGAGIEGLGGSGHLDSSGGQVGLPGEAVTPI